MPKSKKKFWTTLPGLLTGAASLLTAILALSTFTLSNCHYAKDKEPGLLNVSDCHEIAGTWNLFVGGEVKIEMDGSLVWNQNTLIPGAISATGRWNCLNANPRTYALTWQNGLTDHVQLSPDRRSLSGKNIVNGVGVSATRK